MINQQLKYSGVCYGHTIQEVQLHKYSMVALSREEIPQEGFEGLHAGWSNHVSRPAPALPGRRACRPVVYTRECAYDSEEGRDGCDLSATKYEYAAMGVKYYFEALSWVRKSPPHC